MVYDYPKQFKDEKVITLKISIRAARVNADMTQEKAAEKLGISRQSLMRCEKYPDKVPYALAERMSCVYGVPKDNLIFLRIKSTLSGDVNGFFGTG